MRLECSYSPGLAYRIEYRGRSPGVTHAPAPQVAKTVGSYYYLLSGGNNGGSGDAHYHRRRSYRRVCAGSQVILRVSPSGPHRAIGLHSQTVICAGCGGNDVFNARHPHRGSISVNGPAGPPEMHCAVSPKE